MTLCVGFCGQLGKSIVPWRGWAVIVHPDGTIEPVCGGLRAPNGIGRNAAGDMFYTDNQGDWVATCKLSHLEYGDWHGLATSNIEGMEILSALKGDIVGRYYMRGGSLSLPPATYVEAMSDRDFARYDSKPISSYIIKLEHNRACLEFYINVPDLGLIEVGMWFNSDQLCGTKKWHSTGTRDVLGNMKENYDGTIIYDTCSSIEYDLVHASLAAENPITWGQVAPEYEQRKTYYFTKNEEHDPSPADFLELSLQHSLR